MIVHVLICIACSCFFKSFSRFFMKLSQFVKSFYRSWLKSREQLVTEPSVMLFDLVAPRLVN